jgi:hypothetical protein
MLRDQGTVGLTPIPLECLPGQDGQPTQDIRESDHRSSFQATRYPKLCYSTHDPFARRWHSRTLVLSRAW